MQESLDFQKPFVQFWSNLICTCCWSFFAQSRLQLCSVSGYWYWNIGGYYLFGTLISISLKFCFNSSCIVSIWETFFASQKKNVRKCVMKLQGRCVKSFMYFRVLKIVFANVFLSLTLQNREVEYNLSNFSLFSYTLKSTSLDLLRVHFSSSRALPTPCYCE